MSGLPSVDPRLAQAVLTVDLRALADNWRSLAARAAPAECAAVVKADAYGVGIEQATPALAAAGCRTFFVAHPSEGVRVRAALAGDRAARIYVLNGLAKDADARLYEADALTPVLGSLFDVVRWLAGGGVVAALHVDTGMNRLGCSLEEAARVAAEASGLRVDLIMTHMVSSEMPDDPLNARQVAAFEQVRRMFPGVRASLANSSAIFLPNRPMFDLVRPGYALYGGNPTPQLENPMRPVVRLEAPILQVREIPAGATAGYNAQWTAKRPTRLAVIGVGYADGLPRNLMSTDARPGGEAMVDGVRCPFAGRVSMDLTILDVTDVPAGGVAVGSTVQLLGADIGVDDMGARSGTIGYEILTGLGRRYSRVYEG